MVVLRGKLEIVVVSARDLPNTDRNKKDPNNLTDPFVTVKIVDSSGNEEKIGKTPTIDDNLNPKWFHSIKHDVSQDVKEVRFYVKDQRTLKDEKIGCCSVPTHAFCNERGYEGLLDIIAKKKTSAGSLQVKVKFTDASQASHQPLPSTRSVKLRGCVPRNISRRKSQNPANHVHGKMTIKVLYAEKLPNLDLTLLDNKNKTDAFVVVYFLDSAGHKTKIATTKTINDDLNPVWNETFNVNVCHEITDIVFTVYDEDIVTNEKIASIEVPSSAITKSNALEGIFDLRRNGKKCGRMKIGLKLQLNISESFEVENCIFPLRQGNLVRLYQDAHCPRLPGNVQGSFGNFYEPKSAWVDVQESLMAANNFILITGWSVKTSIALIRNEGEEMTLGRILINKANQGVDVRLLLWDEITSNESKKDGAMATFDNETKEYFKSSPVKVSLALRKRKENSFVQENNYFTKFCYSHHQKTIITDAPIPESRIMSERQVIAFVGGLDLTSGRYDTPEHHLFKTLETEHRHDFYNNVVSTSPQSGPRQPWHDIHGKIMGPAAHDVKQNFIDRWNMQGGHDSTELRMNGIDWNYSYKGQDQWSVQVFRSISQDSLSFHNAAEEMLVRKKGRIFDNSLQRAYIHQIQKAEKFIYIENQYFLGSSHFWENCRDIPVKNLIPLEIAAKIATKIKKRQEFVAYILIPMFPEGNPEDMAMQEILHWQFHTIEMMYKMIGEAIRDTGLDTEPQDYLLFFCVGKREGDDAVPNHLRQPIDETAQLAFKNKRSMIYVHSKMAIFDDEYIIVGSANINDRSLGGTRDTEIAMGAYQPHVGRNGCGDVGSFRKCLWLEHLGASAPLHMEPGSITCSRKLRQMTEQNLNNYLMTDGPLPKGHMLIYPLRVETDGMVVARNDCSQFPDTKASTVGIRSKVIPSELTT